MIFFFQKHISLQVCEKNQSNLISASPFILKLQYFYQIILKYFVRNEKKNPSNNEIIIKRP